MIIIKYFEKIRESKESNFLPGKCHFYYSISISLNFNEINDGIIDSKRLKISILHLISTTMIGCFLLSVALSNYLYSFLKVDFIPDHLRLLFFTFSLAFNYVSAIKIDMILAEIKLNSNPLKRLYFLMNDLKSEHKLSDLNYNQLAIWSRLSQLLIIDCGLPITILIMQALIVAVAILSQKFISILFSIFFVCVSQLAVTIMAIWMCINIILISYYKMRFDQIHSSIKSIVSNGRCNVINKRREKQLKNLIEEHRSLAYEVHQFNLMVRWSLVGMIMAFSMTRIVVIYYLIITKNKIFINVFSICVLIIVGLFGFSMNYLFTLQMKSAHQSYKLIYCILTGRKMKFRFRLKVILKLIQVKI